MDSLPILSAEELIERVNRDDVGEELYRPFGLLPPITKGRSTLLGGATAAGKTALGLQWFRDIADSEYRACYITLEMTPEDLFKRFAAQFETDAEAEEWFRGHEAYFTDTVYSVSEIERIVRSQEWDFVAIDHAHELPYHDRLELGEQVKRIYRLAPATDTAILLMAQMRRPDPQFPRPPSKHDFLEWGGFEQMAAVALAIHQEDEHSLDSALYTLKNRYGPKPEEMSLVLNTRTGVFERAW